MIKKLTYLIAFICCSTLVWAQGVMPLGQGLPAEPVRITHYGDGIAAIYLDEQQFLQMQVWNGDFWEESVTPPLPTVGYNANGYLEIKDLIAFNNKIYLSAEHTLDLVSNARNYVLEWNGSVWRDISDAVINNAVSLSSLVVQNNTLQCIGIFSGDTANYNVAVYNGSDWSHKGNLLTRIINKDKFKDIAVSNNKVYATGSFTDPGTASVVSWAEWNGQVWQKGSNPPFLGVNTTVGNYKNALVVYGTSPLTPQKVKRQQGSVWVDISAGLDDFILSNVDQFTELGNDLYMVGSFENQISGKNVTMLKFENNSWKEFALSNEKITNAQAVNNQLYLSGSFKDNGKLNYTAQLVPYSVLPVKVFNDLNKNCVQDDDEALIQNYPIIIEEEASSFMTDQSGFSYIPLYQNTYHIQAAEFKYYVPTCPDSEQKITNIKLYPEISFGVAKAPNIRDAAVEIADNQSYLALTGQDKKVMVCYANTGSEPITGATLKLTHNENLIDFNSGLNYDSYIDNEAIWTVNIAPEEDFCFYVYFTTLSENDIEIDVAIELAAGETDENGFNNTKELRYKKGSTLVNHKYCNNGDIIKKDEEYLHYKIGFKNTGSSVAKHVKIVDELTAAVDKADMFYSSSFYYTTLVDIADRIENGNVVRKYVWTMQNVNVPPAIQSDKGSEGFVDFKQYVVPKKLKVGDEICNIAKIYFSYKDGSWNEPLSTNEVCSSVETKIGIPTIPNITGITVGPNPVEKNLEVSNASGNNYAISISNVLGQNFKSFNINAYQSNMIDMSSIPTGVYFIHANGQFIQKVVVK